MIVSHIIEDVENVLEDNPHATEFDVAFASYQEDGSGSIIVKQVEAYYWEDEEFFLIPIGAAHLYELVAVELKAGQFLKELKSIEDEVILSFGTFARSQIKTLEDGSIASLNSPLWGIGIHHDAKLIYFYHGKQPDAS
jgi:hypothetical protein